MNDTLEPQTPPAPANHDGHDGRLDREGHRSLPSMEECRAHLKAHGYGYTVSGRTQVWHLYSGGQGPSRHVYTLTLTGADGTVTRHQGQYLPEVYRGACADTLGLPTPPAPRSDRPSSQGSLW